jgi:hypothetical protein
MSEQAPRFEYTPEQEAQMAARSAEQAEQPQVPSEFLHGPRNIGDVPMAAGGFERHAISGDGMKYTRYEGNRYKSAAEFHREAGVAQPFEVEALPKQESRRARAGKVLGSLITRR